MKKGGKNDHLLILLFAFFDKLRNLSNLKKKSGGN